MQSIVLLVLIALSPTARADELLCDGTAFATDIKLPHKSMVWLDSAALKLSIRTLNGWAEGIVQAEPDLYLGHVYTKTGVKYWINLHRYTGEFYIGLANAGDQAVGPPEFTGMCKKIERKF